MVAPSRPWGSDRAARVAKPPKPPANDAEIRLRCLEIVQTRSLKAGLVTDMPALIELAKQLEAYVKS